MLSDTCDELHFHVLVRHVIVMYIQHVGAVVDYLALKETNCCMHRCECIYQFVSFRQLYDLQESADTGGDCVLSSLLTYRLQVTWGPIFKTF